MPFRKPQLSGVLKCFEKSTLMSRVDPSRWVPPGSVRSVVPREKPPDVEKPPASAQVIEPLTGYFQVSVVWMSSLPSGVSLGRPSGRLNEPISADWRKAQENEIRTGHCDMLPAMMLPGMVDAQMARDIWMAKLIRDQQPRDVVLIAGNGHVRKDIGVPRWLGAVGGKLTVKAIGYVEGGGMKEQFDEVRSIPAQKRPDPCAKFKK